MVFRVADQMKPSDAFDRDDRALKQEVKDSVQSISMKDFSLSIHQSQGWTASRAGIGLGVEPSINRILILLAADRAHGEGSHGRLVAIIGNVFDDGESRATMRAVDEGIPVAEIAGREELCQARITSGHIRRDQGKAFRCPLALPDFKTGVSLWFERIGFQGFNSRKGRGQLGQSLDETIESPIVTLRIDEYPLFIVQDPSPDGMGEGQIVNKRPVPNALNDACYFNGFSFHNMNIPRRSRCTICAL